MSTPDTSKQIEQLITSSSDSKGNTLHHENGNDNISTEEKTDLNKPNHATTLNSKAKPFKPTEMPSSSPPRDIVHTTTTTTTTSASDAGVFFTVECESISNGTSPDELLDFIQNNIFQSIRECVNKFGVIMFESIAIFELKNNKKQIQQFTKSIHERAIKNELKFNGNTFSLRCDGKDVSLRSDECNKKQVDKLPAIDENKELFKSPKKSLETSQLPDAKTYSSGFLNPSAKPFDPPTKSTSYAGSDYTVRAQQFIKQNDYRRIVKITNLNQNDYNITCDHIMKLFSIFVTVQRVKILVHRRSAALVQLSNHQQAKCAINRLNGFQIYKKRVKVRLTNMRFVSLPQDTPPNAMMYHRKAKSLTKDYTNCKIYSPLSIGQPSHILHIANLPIHMETSDLQEFLCGNGIFNNGNKIQSIELIGVNNKLGLCEVSTECHSVEIACQILIDFHSKAFLGREIKISFATRSHMPSDINKTHKSYKNNNNVDNGKYNNEYNNGYNMNSYNQSYKCK